MTGKKSAERLTFRFRKNLKGIQAAFFGALIFGVTVHGMALFNKFSWHDDIFSLFGTGATITSGRWMLHVLAEAEILVFGDGHFSLPLMNGLFSILCIAASAALTADLLEIRHRALCALLGCVMAAFPVVTALFGFMFTVPYYMLALLSATASAYLICRGSRWRTRIPGILLGGCSVGIYQAFLPVLLTLILLADISDLADGGEPVRAVCGKILTQALCVAGAMAFYFAGSRFFLTKYRFELDSYLGIDQVGSVPLAVYLDRAGRAYREFFLPVRNSVTDMFPQHLYHLSRLMLAADGILCVPLAVRTGRREPGAAVLLVLLFLLFPLGCNFIFVMSEEVHSLMLYGQTAFFMLFVLLADRQGAGAFPVRRAAAAGAALMMGTACVMYARFDNQCYLKTAFQQQEAISYYTTLTARIKSVPGYRDELPVAWVNRDHLEDRSLYNIDELNPVQIVPYEKTIQDYVNNWAWQKFMARWCGFAPDIADSAEAENLPEVRTMPAYPEDGSIRIINGIVVVKF